LTLEHVWPTATLAYGKLIESPEHVAELLAADVTRVVNVCENDEASRRILSWLDGRADYSYLPTTDDGAYTDAVWQAEVRAKVLSTLARSGRVYVHCSAGLNRSPYACYLVLRAVGLGQEETLGRLRHARPAALDNEWFRKWSKLVP
jgi:protein-tyrosine phosphatase